MTQISMRQLQRDLPAYIDKLPVIITRYNIPVAKIVPIDSKNRPSTELTLRPSPELKPTNYSNITDIKTDDMVEISNKYSVSIDQVRSVMDDLVTYCQASGKRYANYKAALINFIKRDLKKGGTNANKPRSFDAGEKLRSMGIKGRR